VLSVNVSGVHLSAFGRSALSATASSRSEGDPALDPVQATDPLKDPTSSESRELQDLKQRDREVRQHEQAHVAAGGAYVRGGASFSTQRGPDGRQYAVGGEVQIDTSAVPGDPAATIRKMQVVRSAALAPANPSAQDRSVAAQASSTENEARAELREEQGVDDSVSADDGQSTDAVDERKTAGQSAVDTYQSTAGLQPQRQIDSLLDLTV
jgi:hypothetical protein